ncbi:MAG: glycosyltransferase family 2 protein [Actinomycetota bacterium]|nr:glycosyltransferase family 2 protein [Actinomycetota bacterium]
MPEPRITVIIPCHDDGELLLEAIRSIDEPEPVEIVVVDDGSTDKATQAALNHVSGAGVKVIRQEGNLGPAAARSAGLEATRGEYVFPLDADDLALPGALAAMADRLEATPEAGVCFGDYEEFGPHVTLRAVAERLDPYRLAYRNDFGAALFRRSILEAVGGWSPGGRAAPGYEDWHLWMSLAERGVTGVHMGPGVPTYRRRIHGNRMLTTDRSRHRMLYKSLRSLHPALFADLPRHRRRSDLGTLKKLLYPVLYGGRPRFWLEPRLRIWLHRSGLRPHGR